MPDIDLYAIDVRFEAHADPAERDYLNQTPTSFVLSDEQVDRLRAAAGAAIGGSPEFKRLLRDLASAVPAANLAPVGNRGSVSTAPGVPSGAA